MTRQTARSHRWRDRRDLKQHRGRAPSILNQDEILTAGEDVRRYLSDATEAQALAGRADAVVLPTTAEAVASVVDWCYRCGVPCDAARWRYRVRGRMRARRWRRYRNRSTQAVRSFEPLLWRAELEAGVTTRTLQRLALENGLYYPVDPGAAEQSHLGGNIATNAGGPHAFKYGVTGAWVTGIEAVVPPGQVIKLGGKTRKDVAGYDLKVSAGGLGGNLGRDHGG